MRRVLSRAAAGLLALGLIAGAPVVTMAQVQTAEAVLDQMAALGMKTEGLVLTEDQVLQIESILNGTDDDSAKVAAINELLGM